MNVDANYRRALVALAVAVLIVAPLSAGTALAQDASDGGVPDVEKVRQMAEKYNERAGEVNLGPASSQLTNNVVNLYVVDESSGETHVYSFRMDGQKRIIDIAEEKNPDANLRMDTTIATVESIAEADNPATEFRDAYASDDISIKPTGFAKGGVVKWTFWTAADGLKGLFF